MPITKMKPLEVFLPISRVDEETRVVEGYAFVNEVVDGEGGLRLKRSAMEKATPDYTRWGNVREMHQAKAVGNVTKEVKRADGEDIPLGVTWDEKGAFMRAYVSEASEDTWTKIKDGTLKGFSIGFKPTVMRGKTVEAGVWYETSIVDRPKDPGSAIAIARFEAGDEIEVETEDTDDDLRALFADRISKTEPRQLRSNAINTLTDVLYDVHWDGSLKPEDRLSRMNDALKEFKAYASPHFARAEAVDPDPEFIALDGTRLERFEGGKAPEKGEEFIISRADYEAVNRTLTEQAAKITTLEATPRAKMPVRFVRGFEKELAESLKGGTPATNEISELRAEFQQLKEDDTATGVQAVTRMSSIKSRLVDLGDDITNL